eukprot:TRINITY_DN111947_c0_g1_i1.p1 TRINITY_DN111947_c0_g1~~TRINITY_DN111947_c0_g1_i1.p1  ORF type:complete len:180 (+),score=29.50 TRINITY_DN111947_c0_g1_i1:90-629(+)
MAGAALTCFAVTLALSAISIQGAKVCAADKLSPLIQAAIDPFADCYEACPAMCKSIGGVMTKAALLKGQPNANTEVMKEVCKSADAWACTVSDDIKYMYKNKTARVNCLPAAAALKASGSFAPKSLAEVKGACAPYMKNTTTTTTTKKATTTKAEVSASNGLGFSLLSLASASVMTVLG